MTRDAVVALTMGDPAGIGPELVVKTLSTGRRIASRWRPVVVGDAGRLVRALAICGAEAEVCVVSGVDALPEARAGTIVCLDLANVPEGLEFGRQDPIAGQAAYEYVATAVDLARAGSIDAICTLPINKAALHGAGHRYAGHTELLADLTGTEEVSMMLDTGDFKVVHVTTHVGLLDAIERIEPGLVYRTIRRAHDAASMMTRTPPTIAVCGINPHAGEGGLFGRGEEADKIAPAVARARAEGIRLEGPLPADAAFFRAARGDFDVVIAMYHDQGHAPVKVLGIDQAVNITIGLPVVRTSVDHGTAFDIAGTGGADERSLVAALRAAVRLAAPQ